MTHHHDDDDGKGGARAAAAPATVAVDCQKLESLISDYVDEQLSNEEKAGVDGHISQCAPCMAFLKQYRFAPEAARRMLLEKVPVDLEARLLSFLKGKCGGGGKSS